MTRRSLWPREHGAYAQLAVPLATALASRTPTLPAALFATAACAAFLANEPLLVVLGHRGPRMRHVDGRRAARRLVMLVALAIGAGATGFGLADACARLACGIAAALGLALVSVAWSRRQHSLVGELVAGCVLPVAAMPVAVASHETLTAALASSAAWSLGFACTVVAVRGVIDRHHRPTSLADRMVALGLIGLWCASVVLVSRHTALLPAIPLVLAALLVAVWGPSATRLRAIGVVLVIAASSGASLAVANARWSSTAAALDPAWHRARF